MTLSPESGQQNVEGCGRRGEIPEDMQDNLKEQDLIPEKQHFRRTEEEES